MDTMETPADLRILIGLTEISGYACNLRAGFAELGVQADLLDLQPEGFRFSDDVPPTRLMRLLQRVSRARLVAAQGTPSRRLFTGAQCVLLPLALIQALRRYNTFVFLYDTSFLRQRELPLLKLLRKRVIYIFCGSDDRPTYLDGGLMAKEQNASLDACVASVRAKKRLIRRVERYADVVITNPSHGLLHERPFVSFPVVGIPRVVAPEQSPRRRSGRLKIIHAPSHPVAKGTAVVRATLDRLRESGYDFDYEIVQGVSNAELRERLRNCDFVVDQVWGDTPMDGLVADAALCGKPAVIGGYGWEESRRLLPDGALPPSETCHPDELEQAIVRLLADADHRQELGERARRFVAERWQAATVAQRLLRLLEGPAPPEWVHDPAELRYVLGWGQPADRSERLVRAIVDGRGVAALGLGDKPQVEEAVLALASVQPVPAPVDQTRAA
jgi:hypothetical protein